MAKKQKAQAASTWPPVRPPAPGGSRLDDPEHVAAAQAWAASIARPMSEVLVIEAAARARWAARAAEAEA